ncbi:MAG: sortase [bacterium]|nr:sortase [bacterium]
MTVVRVLGTLGKTVIALGLIILLFGIFQLWGTGVIEAQAQQDLDNEFSDLLEESSQWEPAPPPPTAPPPSDPTNTPEPNSTPQPSATPPTTDASQPTPSPTPTATAEPAEDSLPQPTPPPEWLAMLYRDQGLAVARLQIPAIGVDKTVVEGVRVSDLRKGPGHYPATPIPGQAGNAAIAGHRTTYGAPFGDIDELLPGDEIIVTTIQGEFVYQVLEQGEGYGHFIVPPTAVEVLDQNFVEHPNRITLTACHPKGSARQRIIVVGELVGEPAPTYPRPGQEGQQNEKLDLQLPDEFADEMESNDQTITQPAAPEPSDDLTNPTPTTSPTDSPTPQAEESTTPTPTSPPTATPTPKPDEEEEEEDQAVPVADSFGEGLNGDFDGLVPAILWGFAALAIWFSAYFAGNRWKKLPSYALSAIPFLIVLFMAFWHIDRVLPSY